MASDLVLGVAATAAGKALEALPIRRFGRPVLLPRLIVFGDGTGTTIAYNLEVRNVGEAVAYDVRFAVPYRQQVANGARLWKRKDVAMEFAKTGQKEQTVRLADLGVHLAPGESVEAYFGQYKLNPQKQPFCLAFVPGQRVDLQVSHFRAPRNAFWRRERVDHHLLTIHVAAGAHFPMTRWTR